MWCGESCIGTGSGSRAHCRGYTTSAARHSPLTYTTHRAAIEIARRYEYGIYDALILAAAIEAGCTTLYSEDMQSGQTIHKLTIRNPFAAA